MTFRWPWMLSLGIALGAGVVVVGPAFAQGPAAPAPAPHVVDITVDGMAYAPAHVKVPAGVPLRLVFLKKDWSGCTREVVFAALGVRASLETGKPVPVDLPPQPKGTVEFACGMGMVKGSLVVE